MQVPRATGRVGRIVTALGSGGDARSHGSQYRKKVRQIPQAFLLEGNAERSTNLLESTNGLGRAFLPLALARALTLALRGVGEEFLKGIAVLSEFFLGVTFKLS